MNVVYELLAPHYLLLYLFAYGLAALPTSYVVAKILHRFEIQSDKVESHTASFIWQKLSVRSAIIVLILDVIKGLLPAAIAMSLDASLEAIAITGFFAVLGHCFSVLLKFSGGHGGVTLAGVLFIVDYPAAVVLLLTNYLFVAFKVPSSLSSMAASLVAATLSLFLVSSHVVWMITFASVVVVFAREWLNKANA